MITLFCIFSALVYSLSIIGSMIYFDEKNYDSKAIYIIAAFTPIWNTYFAIKWIRLRNFKPIIEAIKYHFTWDKE